MWELQHLSINRRTIGNLSINRRKYLTYSMRLVKESKDGRLTMLIEEINKLIVNLRAIS
jgi:hypothetical protein